MPRVREALERLGKSGIAFLGSLILYFALYFSGHGILAGWTGENRRWLQSIPPAGWSALLRSA